MPRLALLAHRSLHCSLLALLDHTSSQCSLLGTCWITDLPDIALSDLVGSKIRDNAMLPCVLFVVFAFRDVALCLVDSNDFTHICPSICCSYCSSLLSTTQIYWKEVGCRLLTKSFCSIFSPQRIHFSTLVCFLNGVREEFCPVLNRMAMAWHQEFNFEG